eukprot:CAMPEP_0115084890 /NCGR_PEP_ID=MMETSP0227-20121206/21584_1 /TAXON_ID=89957 /ORGANISM="Polarella glacialis, Strain CCMP 1383" /LENGTH=346 /DNA_ID=CAMNT_0002473893 /DNA_START=90 /DNA_END=1130 /DNA_ORIENTATION=+
MAPRGRAAKDVRARSRSRSPTKSSHLTVEIRDWVLVRTSSRFWKDAVPALVTKVSGASVCLVLPNKLALQHGFGSKRPFMEMRDVNIGEIRSYTGGGQSQLRGMLLAAISKDAIARRKMQPLPEEEEEEPVQTAEDQQHRSTESATEAAPVEVGPAPVSVGPAPVPVSARAQLKTSSWDHLKTFDPDAFTDDEAASDPADSEEETLQAPGLPEAPAVVQEELPPVATPDRRQLTRRETPDTPEVVVAPSKVVSEVSTVKAVVCQKPAEKKPCLATSDRGKQWFIDFTRAVSKAFRHTPGCQELTRQELASLMGGEAFSVEDVQIGLQRLDQQTKVLLTGDLVFLIA